MKTKFMKFGTTLSRSEMSTVMGGLHHMAMPGEGGGGISCYHKTDCSFLYCIETDGVLFGFWSCNGGTCVDRGAHYCNA